MKRRTFNTLLFLFLFIINFLACKTEVPSVITIENHEELDSILDNYVDEGYYPFIYARLENIDGDVLYEHSVANPKFFPDEEINGDSWIRIWSMSKIITISTALDLIEDGILKFDDPVTKYIPEFENLKVAVVAEDGRYLTELEWGDREGACPLKLVSNDSVMTVLHLINHEAGFYYATTQFDCLDSMTAEKNLATAKNSQELIDRMAQLPLIQHPGTKDFYGTNTTVLGLVAERATGKSLKELVEERVTKPLKIKGLQYGMPPNASLPAT
ncbi:MAG: CubicO group peptidase (beta-lactamase class C family), partial [Saprospiraceae bacterium]